jgi:hypothetical protein
MNAGKPTHKGFFAGDDCSPTVGYNAASKPKRFQPDSKLGRLEELQEGFSVKEARAMEPAVSARREFLF